MIIVLTLLIKIMLAKTKRKIQTINVNGEIKKIFKQPFEWRQKNLTCPHKHYHMKVPFMDLSTARPSCPVCNSPMVVKEELKEITLGQATIEEVIQESNIKAYLV